MTTTIQEKTSPAFAAGCVTGVLMGDQDRRRKVQAELDSMSERDKILFLLYANIVTGAMVVDDGRVYRVDDETGQRKLIA